LFLILKKAPRNPSNSFKEGLEAKLNNSLNFNKNEKQLLSPKEYFYLRR